MYFLYVYNRYTFWSFSLLEEGENYWSINCLDYFKPKMALISLRATWLKDKTSSLSNRSVHCTWNKNTSWNRSFKSQTGFRRTLNFQKNTLTIQEFHLNVIRRAKVIWKYWYMAGRRNKFENSEKRSLWLSTRRKIYSTS